MLRSLCLGALLGTAAAALVQAQPNWVQQSPATSPNAREAAAMVWDGLNKQVVMFGGCTDSACPSADTWVWDGRTWTQKTPSTAPPARHNHCMVYDSAHQQVVLFGGQGSNGNLNDTWVWDGTNWTQKTPAATPSRQECWASFAYDELHQQAILFSRTSSTSTASKTWLWDGSNWTQLNPVNTPLVSFNSIPNSNPLLAYDRGRQQLVLATFATNQSLYAVTWTWDGANWNSVAQTGQVSIDSSPGQAAYDPVTKQILFFQIGQQTYSWNGSGWFLVTPATKPPDRILPGMAFDEVNQQMVLFGGSGNSSSGLASDTWTYGYPTLDWTQQAPTSIPPGRAFVAMTFDGKNNNTVLFGGKTTGNVYLGDTWIWDGSNWTQLTSSQSPAPRDLSAMAYDANHQQVVLFGGFSNNGPVSGYYADTWIWDGSNWTQKTPAHSPPAQAYHSMTYDSVLQRVVLFGGTTCCNVGVTGDTWTWDGNDWTQQSPAAGAPESNAYSVATFDATRGTSLRFDAYLQSASYHPSTWTYNGTTWTSLSPVHTPGARILDSTLAYDSQRQQITLFGGSDANSNNYFADTWVWSGFDWTQIAPVHSPSQRAGFGYAFDPVHNDTVLFGGYYNGAYYSDTWTLGPATTPVTTSVTITVPTGVQYSFNGVNYTGTQTLSIGPGSYTLTTTSPQTFSNGTELVWSSWSDGGAISHSVTVAASPVNITGTFSTLYSVIVLAPVGATFTLNGTQYTSSATAFLAPGTYGLSTTSPQTPSAGTQLLFTSWSDGGAISHNITMGAASMTIRATFQTQYLVTVVVNPPGAGTVAGGGYATAGGPVTLTQTPNSGYEFDDWSGPCSGAGSCYFVAGAPVTVAANYSNPLKWVPVFPSASPSARTNAVMAYDSKRQVTVLFGGEDSRGNLLNDTWEWNGTTWTQRNSATVPTGRYWEALGYDPVRGQTVMFGGLGADDTRFSDTWLWDGNNWTQMSVAGPSARSSTRLAWDPVSQGLLLFGGALTDTTDNAETWLWNGSTWTKRSPAASPSPRGAFTMTLDEARQQVVLFGGGTQAGAIYADTWIWNGSNWSQAAPVTSPEGRWHGAAAYDEVAQQVAIFGGYSGDSSNETWFWDGTNWTKRTYMICPPDRIYNGAAYDAARQQYVHFGGFGSADPIFVNGWYNDTWILANNLNPAQYTLTPVANPVGAGTFTVAASGQPGPAFYAGSPVLVSAMPNAGYELQNWGAPCLTLAPCNFALNANSSVTANFVPARTWVQQYRLTSPQMNAGGPYLAMAYDKLHQKTVLIDDESRTWTYDGSNWTLMNPANAPHGANAEMVYDETNQQMLLVTNTAQTWTWDGANWTQRFPLQQPSQRTEYALAYNGANGTVVLYGGSGPAAGNTYFSDTFVWNGAAGTWTKMLPAHNPPNLIAPAAAYDPVHQVVTMFGGSTIYNAAGNTTTTFSTWLWNGTDWVQAAPTTTPGSRNCSAMVWDAAHLEMVMFGGDTVNVFGTNLAETWVWDGYNWLVRAPAKSPAARGCPAMAYDSTNSVPVLFGGFAGNPLVILSDTWTYGTAPAAASYTLTTTAVGSGTAAQSAGPSYAPGTVAQVTATPAPGYEFEYWSGNACFGSSPVCTVTMTGNKTATANFSTPVQWIQLHPATSPSPIPNTFTENLSMAYDAARQQLVFFGGDYGAGPGPANQTWLWSGATWTQVFPATVPPARTASTLAYDPVHQQVLMFGGRDGNGVVLADTWVWDGANWTQKAIGGPAPPARMNHGMAFDGTRVVLYGGWDSGNNIFSDTWVWDGAAWTQRNPFANPGSRSDFGMVYDAARNQVVLFSHYEAQGLAGDTWIWDGTTWTQRTVAVQPPGGWNAMAYDTVREQAFVMTESTAGAPTQTWSWDGSAWTKRNTTVSPTVRYGVAMGYDAARQQVVMFGGTNGSTLGDTWALLSPSVNVVPQAPMAVRDGNGNYLVTVAVRNAGNTPLTSITLSSGKLGSVAGTPTTPITVTNLSPGATASFTISVPVAQVSSSSAPVTFTGTYSTQLVSNAQWNASARSINLP